MKTNINRRSFVKSAALAGAGITVVGPSAFSKNRGSANDLPVGIIGLDTSHSPAFTRFINSEDNHTGFRVVAAYPYGSRTIESSYTRIPEYTETMKEMGVEITGSIAELLDRVEYVLLVTNDGHPRLEQALEVMQAGKPIYVDKPVAASLEDTIAIYEVAKQYDVPVFSSSSLRYITHASEVRYSNKIGTVTGVDAYSPAIIEPTHPDLFWYGIHGVEILFTILGTGCRTVSRTKTEGTDVAVGTWEGDRLGTFRGIRDGHRSYGGVAYGTEEILSLGPFEGYGPLVEDILTFFRTGQSPIDNNETIEIYAFMEAADESIRRGGGAVTIEEVLSKARS